MKLAEANVTIVKTLEILFKTKSISDVLDMRVEEALEFLQIIQEFLRKIKALNDVGLGYLKIRTTGYNTFWR